MIKLNLRFAERGTLLVEAIAMLGLIAMVTPTLYKKSAERMQEIQDINAASQARTMHNIIETFMEANFTTLMSEASAAAGQTIELSYSDSSGSNYFSKGYSSYVPFGYNLGDIRNFAEPRVFVHTDGSSLVSFIVFETTGSIGKKRASRLAALVGANGGIVSPTFTGSANGNEFMGTGNAWHLDNDMLEDIKLKNYVDNVAEDSLVVTSSEPLTQSNMESDKFLYRGPAENEGEYFRNQMVTDLFMGGHGENTEWAGRAGVEHFYSIYNVRKLTLNTKCTHDVLTNPGNIGTPEFNCNPDLADLYIGKPIGGFSSDITYNPGITEGNTGAAWIYGNLKVLNENFQLFHSSGATAYDRSQGFDVMQFARINEETGSNELEIFRAENQSDSSSVKMMDGFVQVLEKGQTSSSDAFPAFYVGGSSSVGGDGAFIAATQLSGNVNELRLNSPDNYVFNTGEEPVTRINQSGGTVYINGGSSGVKMETYINDQGGILTAGKQASWLRAGNDGTSSEVILLGGQDIPTAGGSTSTDDRLFLVGTDKVNGNYMFHGNSLRASLRGGQLRVYTPDNDRQNLNSSVIGGEQMVWQLENSASGETIPDSGATAILSRYTDILGSTYLGRDAMTEDSENTPGLVYRRGQYQLGVAGSAWVDKFLFARQAWFDDAGLKELHAGFDNFVEYKNSSKAGMLNVYDDSVIIRDRAQALAHSNEMWNSSDILFKADSSGVYMRDHEGAWAQLSQNQARFGNNENYFYASSAGTAEESAANIVGSSLANIYTTGSSIAGRVNIQKDAMIFAGHASSDANTIAARAKEFTILTDKSRGTGSQEAQFYADGTDIRTRYVDFSVEDDNSSFVFKVRPNGENLGPEDAQVHVRGTFLVNDNDVIHIGSNDDTIAGSSEENRHATFEVESSYVQVMARNQDNTILTNEGGSSYAMFKVNSKDIKGRTTEDSDASVYIRRGAIELEASTPDAEGYKYAADEGYGYILANRLVSPGPDDSSTIPHSVTGAYDTYMVNPTYTSVMHDIKLTTRGGARLSDALPDYVLKGVYSLINNCAEGNMPTQPCNITDMSEKADPYIGVIPYPICPAGYDMLATVVPISFQLGQAGPISYQDGRFVVDQAEKQARILQRAKQLGGRIAYPALEETSSYTYNAIYATDNTFSTFANSVITRPEGWFWGFKADYDNNSSVSPTNEHRSETSSHLPIETFRDTGEDWAAVAEPLYFQQNTWLKTSIDPVPGNQTGWNTFIGFLYNTDIWGTNLGGLPANSTRPPNKNNTAAGNAPETLTGTYYWNVFPVPTNTLEAHATVYCYFNRSNFTSDWDNLIDRTDNLERVRSGSTAIIDKSESENYTKRLNDPHLKYTDPW